MEPESLFDQFGIHFEDGFKSLAQFVQIPQANLGLRFISVPPFLVGVVADEVLVEVLHEGKWTIVNRQTEN